VAQRRPPQLEARFEILRLASPRPVEEKAIQLQEMLLAKIRWVEKRQKVVSLKLWQRRLFSFFMTN
jgi:hypothetical protein